jgi:hypothetical protein
MRILVLFAVFMPMLIAAPVAMAEDRLPAQVMLFGVFHFSNPGRDVVKSDQINVMTHENQEYLEALSDKLSTYNPTIVLLEFDPEREPEMQERFRNYVDGSYALSSNEIDQLGFRIAARSAADTIHGFDETNVHWQAEPLFEYLESSDAETNARLSALIEELSFDDQKAHASLSLQELLVRSNDAGGDALNRAIYLLTNHVGDGDNFVGADATASWWHRNFRMYSLIQRHAQPGERVLVIGGQGHTAILRQLLADDRDREAIDVRLYLK